MAISKRINWQEIFIFLFLILFPFGQIIRIGIIQPIDVVVGLTAVYSIITKLKVPKLFKLFIPFLVAASFSWLLSIFVFHRIGVIYGLFYFFRLVAYYFFGVYVWNFIKNENTNRKLLIDSLLSVSIASAIFGWIQYFMAPDIKPLFVYGWDMHLFRLVGTFLDPTFLGLIIVFGLILSIHRCIDSRDWKNIFITIFLLISLAFTYSRASYLAFIAGILVIVYFNRKFKKLLWAIGGLIIVALLLPTAKNHSIEFFRTFSAVARLENYQTTLQMFLKSPVFGIGYNNMCVAYQKFIGPQDFSSHACSGSDSSLLFVLATTGVTGFIIFIYSIIKIGFSLRRNTNFLLLGSSFLALFAHSLFSNSMFYPWIMGYMIILLALSVKEKSLS